MAKPKCVRGGLFDNGHGASTTVEITYGSTTWELPLCAKHAAELDDQIWGWLRLGREKEEQVTFTSLQGLSERLRDAPAVRPEMPAKFLPVAEKPLTRSEVEILALRWTLTSHAQERLEERGPIFGFGLEEVLRTAEHPERSFPSRDGQEDVWVHWRGHVKVVVNRRQKTVITVGGRDEVQQEAV